MGRRSTVGNKTRMKALGLDKRANRDLRGELDDDAIFYLQTRGIDSETAKSLLIYGFANEIIEKIKPISVQDYIHKQFTDWLS